MVQKEIFLLIECRWMSEKYDGIRAYWDPTLRMFLSRNLIGLSIPEAIIQELKLPPNSLDGEIWYKLVVFLFMCQVWIQQRYRGNENCAGSQTRNYPLEQDEVCSF